MTLGVTNNFIPRDTYTIKDSNNSGGADADGQNSFFEEFAQEDATDKRIKAALEREESLVESAQPDYSMPTQSTINDYIDNFLLINAEQVACSNMTQHLIKSNELKETLGFLNMQAAKTMFVGKKRPNFEDNKRMPQFKTVTENHKLTNFFSTGIDGSTNNFFMQ